VEALSTPPRTPSPSPSSSLSSASSLDHPIIHPERLESHDPSVSDETTMERIPSFLDMQRLQEELMTPQTRAELDSLVVTMPGGAVSESPMPSEATLMPLTPILGNASSLGASAAPVHTSARSLAPAPIRVSHLQIPNVMSIGRTSGAVPSSSRMVQQQQQKPAEARSPVSLAQSSQLGEVVIHTLQPLSPPICATLVDGKLHIHLATVLYWLVTTY
jgi:hypothetical protein